MANIPTLPAWYPVTCHTDRVGAGSTFVAIKGFNKDGAQFINEAIARGATRIIVGSNDQVKVPSTVTFERVENPRKALAQESARAADYPARKLTIIGVTGTKGKTTTSFLLSHLLEQGGYKTALISTIKNRINGQDFAAPLTTPQPDYLHQFLKLCVESGVTHVVMEVAAQALSLHRVDEIFFEGIIFTNFSREHLEFYQSLDDYFAAKKLLFNHRKSHGVALINADDDSFARLKRDYGDVFTFGLVNPADVTATHLETRGRVQMAVIGCGEKFSITCSSLAGRYNTYNILAASGMAYRMGVSNEAITFGLASFPSVPGRFEQYETPKKVRFVIDYAHNPSSFEQLFSELRVQTDQLILVFGAGGDRDAGKRPIMGKIATDYADLVILTTDNPRSEDPNTIITDIMAGILPGLHHKVIVELDREKAIQIAYSKATPGALIGLLGKGPDEYQIVGSVKTPFSEKSIIARLA